MQHIEYGNCECKIFWFDKLDNNLILKNLTEKYLHEQCMQITILTLHKLIDTQ